ncbi:hypothetical protein DSC91_004218 [Paraburkholderia caffeinilytica]|nr:hypothetical protein [Paraburkholderia caffeinilytica]AXL51524.1 hypothetical protein DSC91_004218 [Paraburkholderia caffeinilytica]CAB3778594.1 hypothetical protein LMG28690_00734 [Paraburkholderia caffeinilytica]
MSVAVANFWQCCLREFIFSRGAGMGFQLATVKAWADLALTCASLIALPVAGFWAYNNFAAEDTHTLNPNITVSADLLPYSQDFELLVVHAKPKNIGKVPVILRGKANGDIDISVKSISEGLTPPASKLAVAVNEAKLDTVAENKNITSEYADGYYMEPGIEYDEVRSFVVRKNATYLVRVEIHDFEKDNFVDASCIVRAQ